MIVRVCTVFSREVIEALLDMRQWFVFVALAILGILTPGLTRPGEAQMPDFAMHLGNSGLTRLYVNEIRTLCIDGGNLAACHEYVSHLNRQGRHDHALAFTDSLRCNNRLIDLAGRLMKGHSLYEGGRFAEALTSLDSLIVRLPPSGLMVEAVFLRARCQVETGMTDDALLNLRSIEGHIPDLQRPEFMLWLGRCEEERGNLEQARELYDRAWDAGLPEAALGALRSSLRVGDRNALAGVADKLTEQGMDLPRAACQLGFQAENLAPDLWHRMMEWVAADTGIDFRGCPEVVNSLVRMAETREDVRPYCDVLLSRRMPTELKLKLRYARALHPCNPDSLYLVMRETSDPDLKLRCASLIIDRAQSQESKALSMDLGGAALDLAGMRSPDERMALSRALTGAGFGDLAGEELSRLLGDLDPGFDDAAMVSVANLLAEAGKADAASRIYRQVARSPRPTLSSLEAERAVWHMQDHGIEQLDIVHEVERIAAEGASDLGLGDLFMNKFGDYERAVYYYRRALESAPGQTEADPVRLRLIQALSRTWYRKQAEGKEAEQVRAEGLDLVVKVSESPSISPQEVVEALKAATDFLRLDDMVAFDVLDRLALREDLSDQHLYEIATCLYYLGLRGRPHAYDRSEELIGRLMQQIPSSGVAPLASLLGARLKFGRGDYVGALEAYRVCMERWKESPILALCNLGLGECYLYSGGMANAISYLRRAGQSPEIMYTIGRCHDILGQKDSAEVHYRRSISRLSTPSVADPARLRLGLLMLEKNGFEAGLKELDSPIPEVRDRLGRVRCMLAGYRLGKLGYAGFSVEVLRRFQYVGDWYSCDAQRMASELIFEKDPDSAISFLPAEWDCKDIFGAIGLLYDRAYYRCVAGPCSLCLVDTERFKKRFPLATEAARELDLRADLLLAGQGEAGSASAILDSLIASGSRHHLLADVLYKRGIDLLVERDYDGAAEHFRRIIQTYPHSEVYHDACFKLGSAHYMRGRYDSSSVFFGLASQSANPSLRVDALFNLGIALEEAGDLTASAHSFLRLATEFPFSEHFERALVRSGYNHERAGSLKQAIDVYRGLLRYSESAEAQAEALYWIGETFSEMGDHLRAACEFLRVGYSFPEAGAWAGTAGYRAGIECEKAGLVDHAILVYEQNRKRFGTESDWGKASERRLQELSEGS